MLEGSFLPGNLLNLLVLVEAGTLDPKVILELFSMYRDWQEDKACKISRRQV